MSAFCVVVQRGSIIYRAHRVTVHGLLLGPPFMKISVSQTLEFVSAMKISCKGQSPQSDQVRQMDGQLSKGGEQNDENDFSSITPDSRVI